MRVYLFRLRVVHSADRLKPLALERLMPEMQAAIGELAEPVA